MPLKLACTYRTKAALCTNELIKYASTVCRKEHLGNEKYGAHLRHRLLPAAKGVLDLDSYIYPHIYLTYNVNVTHTGPEGSTSPLPAGYKMGENYNL